jgi:hypothetical protein
VYCTYVQRRSLQEHCTFSGPILRQIIPRTLGVLLGLLSWTSSTTSVRGNGAVLTYSSSLTGIGLFSSLRIFTRSLHSCPDARVGRLAKSRVRAIRPLDRPFADQVSEPLPQIGEHTHPHKRTACCNVCGDRCGATLTTKGTIDRNMAIFARGRGRDARFPSHYPTDRSRWSFGTDRSQNS